jgi:hypothetical protein
MKTTTKPLLLLAFLFFSLCIYSQRYAISGGLNFATMSISGIDSIHKEDLVFRTGFRLGIISELAFNDVFSVEPGAILSVKGYNYKISYLGYPLVKKVNMLYLDVPINLKVTAELGNYKLFGLLGPYASIGVRGKSKTDYRGQSEQKPIYLGNNEKQSDLKYLDYGVSLGLGMEIDKASFRVIYSRGLMNISPREAQGEEIYNRMVSVSFAYFFSNYVHHSKYKY